MKTKISRLNAYMNTDKAKDRTGLVEIVNNSQVLKLFGINKREGEVLALAAINNYLQ